MMNKYVYCKHTKDCKYQIKPKYNDDEYKHKVLKCSFEGKCNQQTSVVSEGKHKRV
jgi:hypothetical protein